MNTAEVNNFLAQVPATPECFRSRTTWSLYLLDHVGDKNKPFNADGTYRPEFNFCGDCTLAWSIQMAHAGKCNPSVFRSKEPTNVSHV